ncbi:MAG: endopeptidase La [Bryobacterales bacterium]|nr:endopeptidase La [Bryobacterales bacterium]
MSEQSQSEQIQDEQGQDEQAQSAPRKEQSVRRLPVLPLKSSVLFPNLMLPLSVGRPGSVAAVEAALGTEEKEIIIVAQRDPNVESPALEDLYSIGVRAVVKKMARTGDGLMELLVLGVDRVRLVGVPVSEPYMIASFVSHELSDEAGPEVEALQRAIMELAKKVLQMANTNAPRELTQFLVTTEDPVRLAYFIGSMLSIETEKEQRILEAENVGALLQTVHDFLSYEVQILELRTNIQNKAQSEIGKEQREYYLRQQLRAIQDELGEKNPEKAETEELRKKLEAAELPEDVRKEAERELTRLERMPSGSPENNIVRTYLEYVIELPWTKLTEDNLDLKNARKILDEDHYELKEVKERILEHLAVLKLNPDAKAPILCFAGPPGVGKTSLGQSIARALGRKFERLALGGLHDESELRGHRRTYIGAMPGRIVQAMRRAGEKNPVILLDEVDKVGRDYRGDPSSALLEVLDPEQNKTFRDNYLDMPFDLSKVFFITTANSLDTIPGPLRDRMEIINLSGYSAFEKLEIAKRYLLPRQFKETGVSPEECEIPDATVERLIENYTREAGVRQLTRRLGQLMRKVALKFAEGSVEEAREEEKLEHSGSETPEAKPKMVVEPKDLLELLGTEAVMPEEIRKDLQPGVATGLAYTPTGGDVLYIESTVLPDGKGLTLTGQLGDVMKESAQAAQSYIWSHAAVFGIEPETFKKNGLHIHVPAGATPKDGPSAGITMAVSMVSVYTGHPMRSDTAMTGELTLTGLVTPIGGIKEKVLAARRGGIKRIILPEGNRKDLRDLPEHVRESTEFVFVKRIDDVIPEAIPAMRDLLHLASV